MSVNKPMDNLYASSASERCFNCSSQTYSWSALARRNTIAISEAKIDESDGADESLKRVLGWTDLIAYGISATVGAGIFVVTGQVAKDIAGPAIIFSFMIAAFSSLLSAFCYSEFAARVPLSGSAYTFSYVTLGEFIGWFIGWNLTLEYAISASAIARSWSGYVAAMFASFGVTLPDWLYQYEVTELLILSPLSVLIVVACTLVLILGVKESAMINNVMTVTNILIILFVIICGSFYIDSENWTPFFPYSFDGIMHGAGTVFFSYIGFDSVTTLAGEVKNPGRDLPIGIVGTLAIVTVLYIGVSVVITGMVPYYNLDVNAPLSDAFQQVGVGWASTLVAIGSATTLTATTFASLLGQPRIFYQMAKDGLLFAPFGVLNAKGAPVFGTIVSGAFAAVFAFAFPLSDLTEMISIGTLLAFTVVCAGVLVLRYQDDSKPLQVPLLLGLFILFSGLSTVAVILRWPIWSMVAYAIGPLLIFATFFFIPMRSDLPATFQCPLVPLVPCLAIYINVYLIMSLPWESFVRLVVWTALGLVIYFAYGIRYSRQGLWELSQSLPRRETDARASIEYEDPAKQKHLSGTLY